MNAELRVSIPTSKLIVILSEAKDLLSWK